MSLMLLFVVTLLPKLEQQERMLNTGVLCYWFRFISMANSTVLFLLKNELSLFP